jgi:hypothetical protein
MEEINKIKKATYCVLDGFPTHKIEMYIGCLLLRKGIKRRDVPTYARTTATTVYKKEKTEKERINRLEETVDQIIKLNQLWVIQY